MFSFLWNKQQNHDVFLCILPNRHGSPILVNKNVFNECLWVYSTCLYKDKILTLPTLKRNTIIKSCEISRLKTWTKKNKWIVHAIFFSFQAPKYVYKKLLISLEMRAKDNGWKVWLTSIGWLLSKASSSWARV